MNDMGFVRKIGKNLCAFVLAIGAVVSSIPGITPEVQVEAATTKAITLSVDTPTSGVTTADVITDTQERLNFYAKITGNYVMKPPPDAFKIYTGRLNADGSPVYDSNGNQELVDVTSQNLFSITRGSSSAGMEGYILAPTDALKAAVQTGKQYTVRPVFSANGVASGNGIFRTGSGTDNSTDPPTPVPGFSDGQMTVELTNMDLPLLDDTSVSVSIPAGAGEGTVTGVSSYLAQFCRVGDTVYISPTNGQSKDFNLTITGTNSSGKVTTIQMKLILSNTGVDLSKQGITSIQVFFNRPPADDLMITAITPAEALHTEYQSLSQAEDGETLPTAENGEKYITLHGTDTLSSIGSNTIDAVSRVPRAHGNIYLEWEWKPLEADGPLGLLKYEQQNKQFVRQWIPDTNVSGFLVARLYYLNSAGEKIYSPNANTSNPIEIPVTILGRGELAKVQRISRRYGYYANTTDKATDTSEAFTGDDMNIDGQSLTMEVFDGSTKFEFFNPLNREPPYGLEAYKYELSLDFGTLMNAADSLVIEPSVPNSDVIRVELDGGSYTWGNKFTPTRASIEQICKIGMMVYAQNAGNVRLNFKFYKGTEVIKSTTVAFSVLKHVPNDNAKLESLNMKGVLVSESDVTDPLEKETIRKLTELYNGIYPTGIIDYDKERFNPNQRLYERTVPYIVKQITLKPIYQENSNINKIIVTVNGVEEEISPKGVPKETLPITLPTDGSAADIVITTRAQDGQTDNYQLKITRGVQNDEARLKNLIVKPEKDSPEEAYFELEPAFDEDWTDYEVHVNYNPGYTWVEAIPNDQWAAKIDIEKQPAARNLFAAFKRSDGEKKIEDLKYEMNSTELDYNVTLVTIKVTPETGRSEDALVYNLRIIRDDPSENDDIKEPVVSYWLKGNLREEKSAALDNYSPTSRNIFTEQVEYSTDQVRFTITPDDYRARAVTIKGAGKEVRLEHHASGKEPQPITFPSFTDVTNYFDENNYVRFEVIVEPEKPGMMGDPYYIIIERQEPRRDSTANIELENMVTNEGIDFGYQPGYMDYTYNVVEIPYVPGDMRVQVTVTTPADAGSTVTINGETPRPGASGNVGTAVIPLTMEVVTNVKVVITAEDGSTNTITIPLKFKGPSKNCYLSALDAGGFKYLPDPTPFSKTKTSYKIEIPKGIASFPVTATLLKDGSDQDSSNATITINGVPVEDAAAYTFQPTDKNGKITVVVTAQDGKTKRTYTISYKNWNLLNPGTDNTLKDLKVDYGDMQPEFSPNTLEYDVYVKPDAMNLKIYPKLKDANGHIRVVAGKVLTEFDGYYSTSLMEDDMDIIIYVWSEKDVVDAGINSSATEDTDTAPTGEAAGTGTSTDMRLDKAKARQYILHVYRNDDEKIGNLKPITADMVDFDSADPIVIDITKYAVISADVFNTLKTDYADKSILFKGNDYTLQVFGADINVQVPSTDTFDLKFSFYTPDQDKIEDLLDDIGSNDRIDPVYYYFNQHGALPAEMLLTVNLGRHYRNQNLYWNYYNPERERIDYYGYVHTNATGTFSVPLSHFSTYLSTEDKIRGAENKSDEYGNPAPASAENLNAPGSANKAIPNTGVSG